jgi:hypothetical protein
LTSRREGFKGDALKGRILYADPAQQIQDSVGNSAALRKDTPSRSRSAVSRLGNKKEVGSKHPPGHQGPRKEEVSKQTTKLALEPVYKLFCFIFICFYYCLIFV